MKTGDRGRAAPPSGHSREQLHDSTRDSLRDAAALALAIVGLFIAGVVKGLTGIGYSTTALPLLTVAIGIDKAMPLVLVPSITSNLFVMADAGHFGECMRRFWPLYAAMIPGLAAGLAALAWVDKGLAAAVLGAVIVAFGVFALARPGMALRPSLRGTLMAPTGLLNGVVNGLTGSQMMPMMPYLIALGLAPNQLVQAANIGFTMSSCIMMAGLAKVGFLTWTTLAVSVTALLPALGGVKLGTILRRRFSGEAFRTIVLVVLIGLGVHLVVRHFL